MAAEAQIKKADMSEEMQKDAIAIASEAMESKTSQQDIALHIKTAFDEKHTAVWHCIVGKNFGSYVTHEEKHFIYFFLKGHAILLFKAGFANT
ncbi:unnamed protein product [Closterium sp. NIES-64]|nr:unnamed protein product [Closterium sp. NIES-64]CAI5990735.1 unnamed protein product [Closterium sp. NIES-65]